MVIGTDDKDKEVFSFRINVREQTEELDFERSESEVHEFSDYVYEDRNESTFFDNSRMTVNKQMDLNVVQDFLIASRFMHTQVGSQGSS